MTTQHQREVISRLQRQLDNRPAVGRKATTRPAPKVRERLCRYDGCEAMPIGDVSAPIDLCREHLGQAWHLINALRTLAA